MEFERLKRIPLAIGAAWAEKRSRPSMSARSAGTCPALVADRGAAGALLAL